MPISLQLVDKSGKAPRPGPSPKEKDPFLPEEPPASPPPVTLGRQRSILVVDDNPVVLKAFELKLKASGFKVTTISNGAAVAASAEQINAELIILDINFPPGGGGGGMQWSGFTIVQWVRRFPELAAIPVILITGEDVAKHREKARDAGVVAIFQKPINAKELLDAILQTLGDKPISTPLPAKA